MKYAWPLAFLAAVTAQSIAETSEIPWSTDYSASMAKAVVENKPVLIDFTAKWCGWCKRLDEEVYADGATAKALGEYICVKVDVDAQQDIALAYNVQSMPRTVVINVNGEIVGDRTGYMPLGAFLEFLTGLTADIHRKTGGTLKPEVTSPAIAKEHSIRKITAETSTDEIIAFLGDRDRKVRDEALRFLDGRPGKLELLIAALANDRLGARITALEALRKSGITSFAFDPWATKVARDAALLPWKEWLAKRQTAPPNSGYHQ